MIFLHQPVDHFDAVDPSYELRTDDYAETGIEIQNASAYGGGYGVNEYDDEGVLTIGFFKTLKAAKAAALAHYAKRT